MFLPWITNSLNMKINMKKISAIILIVAVFLGACSTQCPLKGERQDCQTAKVAQQRKIAVQMFTFKNYTFEESVPWLAKNGVRGLGITAGQYLSKKFPKLRFGPKMDAQQRKWFKDFVKQNNCWIASFGVTNPKDAKEVEELCAFAKEMGVPLILTESRPELLPAWEKSCQKYGVKMAIHNHASNSGNNYYNPKIVMDMIKPYKNIGACPDNGHWSRSGIDSVYGYKALSGKIFAVHIKDQAEYGNIKNQCVPFGEGVLDMEGMLAELDRQGFDGPFIIEYEAKWNDNLGDVLKCARYLESH